jgi:hypothetical protein
VSGQGATRHDTAELGSARRKHRFVYCCVIAGTCFEVIVLAWRKYATIFFFPRFVSNTAACVDLQFLKLHYVFSSYRSIIELVKVFAVCTRT